jgi:hypothetical protein
MVAKSILTAGSALTSKILYGSFDLYTARWPLWYNLQEGKSVTKLFYGSKSHSLLNVIFRYADLSRRHEAQVPLVQPVLWFEIRYRSDTRYVIPTGIYLPYMRMRCYGCSEACGSFVPVDTTMPFKTFHSVVAAYRNADYRQIAKDVKFASWAELVATKSEVLRAWIRSQGFACSENSRRHAVLVERADSIRMWLKDPQLFERPAKAHAPGDLYYRNRVQNVSINHVVMLAISNRKRFSREKILASCQRTS